MQCTVVAALTKRQRWRRSRRLNIDATIEGTRPCNPIPSRQRFSFGTTYFVFFFFYFIFCLRLRSSSSPSSVVCGGWPKRKRRNTVFVSVHVYRLSYLSHRNDGNKKERPKNDKKKQKRRRRKSVPRHSEFMYVRFSLFHSLICYLWCVSRALAHCIALHMLFGCLFVNGLNRRCVVGAAAASSRWVALNQTFLSIFM